MSLPSFLVIGAQRAGSSILHQILSSHPEVYVPRGRKEIHYFDRYHHRGIDWYRSYFPDEAGAAAYRAIGEATPDYLGQPEVAQRIHALLPDCQLIVILRNPTDRAYSWYQYCRRNRNLRLPFADFLDSDPTALDWGLYHRHLTRYAQLFPRSAMFPVIYEELIEEPEPRLAQLASFLRLREGFPAAAGLLRERVNSSAVPRNARAFAAARRLGHLLLRHDVNWPVRVLKRAGVAGWFGRSPPPPPIDEATRRHLSAYYAADIAGLSELLERDLRVWGPP